MSLGARLWHYATELRTLSVTYPLCGLALTYNTNTIVRIFYLPKFWQTCGSRQLSWYEYTYLGEFVLDEADHLFQFRLVVGREVAPDVHSPGRYLERPAPAGIEAGLMGADLPLGQVLVPAAPAFIGALVDFFGLGAGLFHRGSRYSPGQVVGNSSGLGLSKDPGQLLQKMRNVHGWNSIRYIVTNKWPCLSIAGCEFIWFQSLKPIAKIFAENTAT